MRGKQNPPQANPEQPKQTSLPEALCLDDEAPGDAKHMAYLVTFPHPRQELSSTGEKLVAPGSKTKQFLLSCVLDACARPIYTDSKSIHQNCFVELTRCGVWREFHTAGADGTAEPHDHTPVLAARGFRYLPVKRALLQRHGLASHWSCTHLGYWSCARYLVMPSPKKPLSSLDHKPVLWSAFGTHPPLQDCVHAPITAAAMGAKRHRAEQVATEAGKADPRITDLDVWALVVRANVRNGADDKSAHHRLAQYAKANCGSTMVNHLFRIRHKLPSMIDDIWQWECIDEVVAYSCRTRLDALTLAAASPCQCKGRWLHYVVGCFLANSVNISELCRDIHTALSQGRGETTPIIVLAGATGGEGKSIFLKALFSVFPAEGLVFARPDKGSFPLLGLESAKVAFLDEWRFDPTILSWASQCLWFDGSALPITRPQNVAGASGHTLYKGSAPIFVTCKLPDLDWLERMAAVDPNTGRPWDADASMVLRRLKIYRFGVRMPKPPGPRLPFCARCFAQLVLEQSGPQ